MDERPPENLEAKIEAALRGLAGLEKQARERADAGPALVEAIKELSTALEELHVASEELHHQNESLEAAHQVVELERQRYQGLFDFAPDGYLVTDADGVIREANGAVATLLGASPEYLAGKPLAVFISAESLTAFYGGLNKLRPPIERLEDWQLRLQPRESAPFPASLTVGAAQDAAGRVTGLRWLIRDITDRKRAEEELRSARDQLRALAAHRETALEAERASIAHEAREELAQVLATLKIELTWVAKTLREDQLELRAQTQSLLPLIDTAMRSALRIATDLRPSPLDDLGLVPAIVGYAQEFQARTGIRCQLTSSLETIDLNPEGRTAVFRIFQEILATAARRAGVSRVQMDLRVEEGHLVLSVEDDGKRPTDREITQGESLGQLSLRERASLLGGDVAVACLPEGGATVTVRVPLGGASGLSGDHSRVADP